MLIHQETNIYGTPLLYPEREGYTSLGGSGLSGVMFVAEGSESFFVVGDTVFRIQKIESLPEREGAEYLPHDLSTTVEAAPHHGWSSIFQQETATKVVAEEQVVELPEKISVALDRFAEGDLNRLEAYERAESVVELLEEYSGPWEYALALRIPQLKENHREVFYSTLADCEVQISNPILLSSIAADIDSMNKYLAQSAAACLHSCGSEYGHRMLKEMLENGYQIPHRSLIISLLGLLR